MFYGTIIFGAKIFAMRMLKNSCSVQSLLQRRALLTRSVDEQMQAANAGEPLRRCLGSIDLLLLGLGSILGAGAFVLTGVAAHEHAGCSSDLIIIRTDALHIHLHHRTQK